MIRRLDFSNVLLYAVTPEIENEDVFWEKIDGLLLGGVDVIQLRSKKLADQDLLRIGAALKEKCAKAGALFIINNRLDLALAIDADGVHLGHRDMPIAMARKIIGYKKIIGASTHSVSQALSAQKEGADYISCGPIWGTPTKPEYDPVGLGMIDLYRASVRIPFVVIGGVNESNIDEVVGHGAKRVAVVRALFDASDVKSASQNFRSRIQKNWKPGELDHLEVAI